MKKELNILIVDDHPLIIDAYINILKITLEKYNLKFLKSTNSREALNKMKLYNVNNKNIELAIFDINIPPYKDKNIHDGSDLALQHKNNFPNSKIIMISMHSEGCILYKIIKEINPNGILNKSDLNLETLANVIEKVLNDEIIYSETVKASLDSFYKTKFNLDNIDSDIIRLLNKGIKTKDIPNHIGISLSAIEKRKKIIKFYLLEKGKGNDKALIENAKKLNLI